jgi:uncharacterized delta-60 repeat protein
VALFDNFFCFGITSGAAIQADGKIVVACSDSVVRFGVDLSFDTAFGQLYVTGRGPAYGLARISFGGGTFPDIRSLALQSNGRVIVAGTASAPGANRFALARLNLDGSNDSTFGAAGVVLSPALIDGSRYGDQVSAMALQSDGKILVAGLATDANGNSSGAVVRYLGDPNIPLLNMQHGRTPPIRASHLCK